MNHIDHFDTDLRTVPTFVFEPFEPLKPHYSNRSNYSNRLAASEGEHKSAANHVAIIAEHAESE